MIYEFTPNSTKKLYGHVLNEHIKLLPDDAWICVRDRDTMYLTPHSGELMELAIKEHPDCILFTCATNRSYGGLMLQSSDILAHCKTAHQLQNKERKYTPITGVVPAFFWLFPKSTWDDNPFDELPIIADRKSFDLRWWKQLPKGKILKMEHLYIFHLYRLYKHNRSFGSGFLSFTYSKMVKNSSPAFSIGICLTVCSKSVYNKNDFLFSAIIQN